MDCKNAFLFLRIAEMPQMWHESDLLRNTALWGILGQQIEFVWKCLDNSSRQVSGSYKCEPSRKTDQIWAKKI